MIEKIVCSIVVTFFTILIGGALVMLVEPDKGDHLTRLAILAFAFFSAGWIGGKAFPSLVD